MASLTEFLLFDADFILAGQSGLFLRNCQPFPVEGYTTDPISAEKLWKLSEKLVGQKFDI